MFRRRTCPLCEFGATHYDESMYITWNEVGTETQPRRIREGLAGLGRFLLWLLRGREDRTLASL